MAPPRRIVSKPSPAIRKNPAVKVQPVTLSKGKASPSKKTGDDEECAIFILFSLLHLMFSVAVFPLTVIQMMLKRWRLRHLLRKLSSALAFPLQFA